jgi:hypothetical protein
VTRKKAFVLAIHSGKTRLPVGAPELIKWRIAREARHLDASSRAPRDARHCANPMLFLERQMNSLPTGLSDRSGDFGSV